jgi:cell division protein FtsZ
MSDDILKQAVEGISDLITIPGIINVDFADIKAILKDAGSALMGIGIASGEKRAEEAAKMAINSPLLDLSVTGARGVLFSISGGDDLTMFEIQDAAKVITESMDPDAKVIFGTINDPSLKKGDVKVTLIASGFPEGVQKKSLFSNQEEAPKEERNKIFNTPPSEPKIQKQPEPIVNKELKIKESEEEDEWGAVPAFLRRSKIK